MTAPASPTSAGTSPSWATAGSRPWRCRCAWTARAALVGPERRARAHYRDVRHRMLGVEDVFGPVPVVETASNAVAEGALAARTLLDVPVARRPTAVLAQSDILAAGVLFRGGRARAATCRRRLGHRIRRRRTALAPPTVLTTVVQPTEARAAPPRRRRWRWSAVARPRHAAARRLRIGTTSGPPPV